MELSVIELAIRVRVYTLEKTRSVHFQEFIDDCATTPHDYYNGSVFYAEVTGGGYILLTARGHMIRSTTYRLLHHFIFISLMHHKNFDKVPSIKFVSLMDDYYDR